MSNSSKQMHPKDAAQRARHAGFMPHFDEQTAQDLEFDVVKVLLLNHCHNPTTIQRAESLHPSIRPKQWRQALERTKEFLDIRREGKTFPAVGCEEIAADNDRLAIRDAVLDETGFARIRTATLTVNEVIDSLQGEDESFPNLCQLIADASSNLELPQAIDGVFDAKGQVRSNASPKLIQIREEGIRLRRTLNRQFVKELKRNQEQAERRIKGLKMKK